MFLNNLDPFFYAMQMQNPDLLKHAQMKRQVDADKFIDAQRPEIELLMDINTFEFIHKTKLPAKTRYIYLIWAYRRNRRRVRSLKKIKPGFVSTAADRYKAYTTQNLLHP
jgi:hypothetical protein